MSEEAIKIGLLGLGTVGSGAYKIIEKNQDLLKSRTGIGFEVTKILVSNPQKKRRVNVPQELLTTDTSSILHDPQIDVVVELMGGVTASYHYIKEALEQGKYVVTANKDLMATKGEELHRLAAEKNVKIFYEASVGGGIPLIRPLQNSLGANRILRIMGIINGTTNYILTKMSLESMDFDSALAEAQAKGFAEKDPSSDLEGWDAAYKLAILARLAFDSAIDIDDVHREGISMVDIRDIQYAKELGFTIKLLAIGEDLEKGIALKVHPTLVPLNHPLASVNHEFNALFVEGDAVGEVMFFGRGAGEMPTGSSVVADLMDAAREIKLGDKSPSLQPSEKRNILPVSELVSPFYLRLQATDEPGVFGYLATVFGGENISLDMIIQKRSEGGIAEIVLVTHAVQEKKLEAALNKVHKFAAIERVASVYRVIEKK
ncbi:MAG: homoserine dehydrogenase [Firmicutes bacterium]|nr:homoserine dehydrogenase [Bacillota bacterium]